MRIDDTIITGNQVSSQSGIVKVGGLTVSGTTITSPAGPVTIGQFTFSGSTLSSPIPKQYIVQEYYSGIIGVVSYGSVSTPSDQTTAPVITNGVQIYSGSITTRSTSGSLEFYSVNSFASSNGGGANFAAWLHLNNSGTITTALSSTANGSQAIPIVVFYRYNFNTQQTINFQLRGGQNTGNLFLNGGSATAHYGNTITSFLRVRELITQ